MTIYCGVLPAAHFQAVARVAIQAHGFTVNSVEFQHFIVQQKRTGCWLRDEVLPAMLPPFASIADYRELAEFDPHLWDRLICTTSAGFAQASALHRLLSVASDADTAAQLGAVFNTTIALFDYLVDECPEGASLFELLDVDLVSSLFDTAVDVQVPLSDRYRHSSGPRLRLLIGLIASYTAGVRRLYTRRHDLVAWRDLRRTILSLLEAEQRVSRHPVGVERQASLRSAMEIKSSVPAIAMVQHSRLITMPTEAAATWSIQAARLLGQIVWYVDDLVDFLPDYQQGRPNLCTTRLFELLQQQGRTCAADADLYQVIDMIAGELAALLVPVQYWTATTNRSMADQRNCYTDPNLVDALAVIHRLACLTVATWLRWRETPTPRTLASERTCPPVRAANLSVEAAVNMLLAEQRAGYGEATHELRLPRRSHLNEQHYETHSALLFQRALVLDSLLDAVTAGTQIPASILHREALTILCAKHRDVRGGWSYIPEILELPPDADDLGQVLQVLYRLGGAQLATTCDEPLRLALDAAGIDGSIATWILDPRGRSRADTWMRAYIQIIGGRGAHPDVVANLLYAIMLYDPVRYWRVGQHAADYLLAIQDVRGAWSSQWYADLYYGTFRAVTALHFLSPQSPALKHTRRFLLEYQHADGSWGETCGNPLSTALALLGLTALAADGDGDAIKHGSSYLQASQHADGSWPASPWLAFMTADGPISYGSRTITTAFCLKALLAANG